MDKTEEEQPPKPATLFRQNQKKMKQLGIEKSAYTLASVCLALSYPGNQLTDNDLLSLLQDKTQQVDVLSPIQTEIIQNFKLLQNHDGIIQLNTANAVPIKMSFIKLYNSAHFKIIPLDNDDLKIKIIDGVEYESGSFREKINSFLLELSTGNIVLDLGREHLILSKNLKRDLRLDAKHPLK